MTKVLEKWIKKQESSFTYWQTRKNNNSLDVTIDDMEHIVEYITESEGMILIYFDKDFNVIDYGIDKVDIKTDKDVLHWIKHLSGKGWSSAEIISQFITLCEKHLKTNYYK